MKQAKGWVRVLQRVGVILSVVGTQAFGSGVIAVDFAEAEVNPAAEKEPAEGKLGLVIGATKDHGRGVVGEGGLSVNLGSTSAAFVEAGGMFTANPIELLGTGDWIRLLLVMRADAGILQGNTNSALAIGLYDSGGVNAPAGVIGQIRFDAAGYGSGGMQGWKGYLGQIENVGGSNKLFARPAQPVTTNSASQELLFPGNTGGLTGQLAVGSGGSGYSMADGGVYTLELALERGGAGMAVATILYAGAGTDGTVLATVSGIASGASQVATAFDAVGVGYIRKGTSGDSSLTLVSMEIDTNRPNLPARIVSQPVDLTLTAGGSGSLLTVVSGNQPVIYRWYKGEGLVGQDPAGPELVFADADASIAGEYYLEVENAFGIDRSATVQVAVTSGDVAPTIQQHPAPANAVAGGTVTLTVSANGTAPLSYDWMKNGNSLGLPSSNELVLSNVQLDATGDYSVRVWNALDSVDSDPARVEIWSIPQITQQPQDVLADGGQTVVLEVAATGVPAPTIQWYKDGAQLGGRTGPVLQLVDINGSNAGVYHAVASNSAGTAPSEPAKVNVLSAASIVQVMPDCGTTELPTDLQVVLEFDRPMLAGRSGRVRVFNSAGTLVDSIDFAATRQVKKVGGLDYNYDPVIADGNRVIITLHTGVLAYGGSYYAQIEPGAIVDADGATFAGIDDSTTITFSTRTAPPAAGRRVLTVSLDGTADFATVQGAIDFVPAGNPQRVVIQIADGTYHELIYIHNTKTNITLQGQSRDGTVITYLNNANRNSSNQRASFFSRANDLVLHSLTLFNSTPKGGSQAEALNSAGQRVVVNNCAFYSLQDTHKLDGSIYLVDCYIEGDVDYMWGSANAFFENCHLHTVYRGYLTQVRNNQAGKGFVYLNCTLTGETAAAGTLLGRVDPGAYPYSSAAYINCAIGPHIDPVGWRLDNTQVAPNLRYYEFGSTDLDGNPLDLSKRLAAATIIDAELAAQYRDPQWVLGWNPAPRAWESALRPASQPQWALDPALGWIFRGQPASDFPQWIWILERDLWSFCLPASNQRAFFFTGDWYQSNRH